MADRAQTIDPEIRGEIRDIVEQSLRFGAPGLSDAVRSGIARNIAFKVSHAVCWRPHDQLMAVARRKTESIRAAFGPGHSPDDGEVSFLLRMAECYVASYPAPLAWRPPDTAPPDTEVEVRVGAMAFLAKLVPGGGMTMDGDDCDQWQATRDGEHPPCWSDGCCWASNEDEDPSMPVEAWRPVIAAPGIDARSAETSGLARQGESPVTEGQAPSDPAARAPTRHTRRPDMSEISKAEKLMPGVWYRHGGSVFRLREVEGKGRYNWSAPGVRALENEVLCWVEGATAEVVAERIHGALTGAFLDVKPNLGTETPEPSLREIVRRYYAAHFSPDEADRLTEQYCAAVQIWTGPASLTPED